MKPLTKKQILDRACQELYYQLTRAYWGRWSDERGFEPPWDRLCREFDALAAQEYPDISDLTALSLRMVKAGGSRSAHERLIRWVAHPGLQNTQNVIGLANSGAEKPPHAATTPMRP